VFRRSVGFLLNPEAQSLIAAITGGIGHLYTLFPAGIPQSAAWVSDQSSPTWLRRGHRCERGRLARGEVPSLNEARERRRRHNTQSAGKPRTRGKDARGLTFSRSNSCFVPDEVRVNRLPGGGRGAAVNANEMTSPVVTLGAEVANPWRARCPKRGTPGSEEGVVETTQTGTAPCPYPTSPEPLLRPSPATSHAAEILDV